MKNTFGIFIVLLVVAAGIFSCKDEKGAKSDIPTAGETTIYVDETVQPVTEDVLAVFHSVYTRAHITQVNRNETDVVNAMIKDSARVVVLSRLLTDQEETTFKKKKITPEITQFATDAIAFITNKAAKDSVINLDEIVKVIKGGTSDKIQKLIFDNPGSSSVQYLLKYAGVKKLDRKSVV